MIDRFPFSTSRTLNSLFGTLVFENTTNGCTGSIFLGYRPASHISFPPSKQSSPLTLAEPLSSPSRRACYKCPIARPFCCCGLFPLLSLVGRLLSPIPCFHPQASRPAFARPPFNSQPVKTAVDLLCWSCLSSCPIPSSFIPPPPIFGQPLRVAINPWILILNSPRPRPFHWVQRLKTEPNHSAAHTGNAS